MARMDDIENAVAHNDLGVTRPGTDNSLQFFPIFNLAFIILGSVVSHLGYLLRVSNQALVACLMELGSQRGASRQ